MNLCFVLSVQKLEGTSIFLLCSSPPSYCWVGDALSVASNEQYRESLYPRLILTNSVMDEVSKSKDI